MWIIPVLSKRTLDVIAQRYGFPEAVIGARNQQGIEIERVWMSIEEPYFAYPPLALVVVHTNHWKKVWLPMEFDITDQGDPVYDYIKEGHSFKTYGGLDGYNTLIKIFEEDQTLTTFMRNPCWGDASSQELEARLRRLYEQTLRHVTVDPFWYLCRAWASNKGLIPMGRTLNRNVSNEGIWVRNTDFMQTQAIANRFGHSGAFDEQLTDNPIEVIIDCGIQQETGNRYNPVSNYKQFSGGYVFMKTRDEFRGNHAGSVVVLLEGNLEQFRMSFDLPPCPEDFVGLSIRIQYITRYKTWDHVFQCVDPENPETLPPFWDQLKMWIEIIRQNSADEDRSP